MTDVAAEITNSVAVDGQSVMTGQLKLKDGTAASPAWTFGSETNTGFYRSGAAVINVSFAAASKYSFSATALTLPATPSPGDNSLKAATTGYVDTSFAPLASPVLTGNPTAPTATSGDNDTSVATTAFVTTATTGIGGFKSKLTNGGFEVWQRGAGGAASFAIAASGQQYGPDRWFYACGANQASVLAQVAGLTTTSRWACKVQRNSGQTGTSVIQFEQPFDLAGCFPLRGQVVTLSFTAKAGANYSPASGNLPIYLMCGTGAAARRSSGAYTSETQAISGTAVLTTTPTRFTYTSTAIPASTTQMSLYMQFIPVGTAGADDSFTIDDVQLEIAPVATTFEEVPFDVALARCQYWYNKTFPYATLSAASVNNDYLVTDYAYTNAAGVGVSWDFPAQMRITPTIVTFRPDAAGTTFSGGIAVTVTSEAERGALLSASAGTVSGTRYNIHATADAEL